MDFAYTQSQQDIRAAMTAVMTSYGDDYWLNLDNTGEFPEAFYRAMVDGGWLGMMVPEAYGGSELGLAEAVVMMMSVADSGGAMAAASVVHMNIFGPRAISVFGSEEQKQVWLPEIINGQLKCCFGVTEPDAGLDTGSIRTVARRTDTGYVVDGRKVWISTAQHAGKIMLLARTTPAEANAAKYFAGEAGFKAATQAVLTFGGMGYAKEFHVERLLRESMFRVWRRSVRNSYCALSLNTCWICRAPTEGWH